jgi:hypothetical protein
LSAAWALVSADGASVFAAGTGVGGRSAGGAAFAAAASAAARFAMSSASNQCRGKERSLSMCRSHAYASSSASVGSRR